VKITILLSKRKKTKYKERKLKVLMITTTLTMIIITEKMFSNQMCLMEVGALPSPLLKMTPSPP
jgi:hypothetical protein